MNDLHEREPKRAADLYTAKIAAHVHSKAYQRNAVKLITAKWSVADSTNYPTILGISQKNSTSKDAKAVASMENTMQTSWIGLSS